MPASQRTEWQIKEELKQALDRKAEAELSVILLTNELNKLHVQNGPPINEIDTALPERNIHPPINETHRVSPEQTIYEKAGFHPNDRVRRLKVKAAQRDLVGKVVKVSRRYIYGDLFLVHCEFTDRSRVTTYYPENLVLVSQP